MVRSKEEYEFKKKIKALKSMRGQGTELISIYIPPGYSIHEITGKLNIEAGQAQNIKSKQTRKNVAAAIERLLHALKGMNKPPPKGIAIFAGNLSRDVGGDKVELINIEPLVEIQIQTYRCDSTFFIEPLEEMLEPKELYGLITFDRRDAVVALVKGKKIEIIRAMGSQVPGKHRAGGQSAARFERLIEIAYTEWSQKVGETANKAFEIAKVKGVIVGGPGHSKNEFVNGSYLTNIVKNKIIGIVDTSYTDEFGIRELMQKSEDIAKDLEIIKEKKLVNRFMKEASVGKLAAYGLTEVKTALHNGQVDILLISEALEHKTIKTKCPACGKEKTFSVEGGERLNCICGHEMQIVEETDLVDELSDIAEDMRTDLEMISTDTPEGEQFYSAFGGIGAILRYS